MWSWLILIVILSLDHVIKMFTGIIHGQGEILAIEHRQGQARLTIKACYDLDHIVLGESIAVNGACLSVETCKMRQFTAYASQETMNRTTLGNLRIGGDLVNLERALALGDRLGGHIVSGHVDCIAIVQSIKPLGESRKIRIKFPSNFAPEIIQKGSVALDGISLTINECGSDFLEVNVIPETWKSTTVKYWTSGMSINMETDVLGKYVHHMLTLPMESQGKGLSLNFLHDNGFI